MYSFVLAISGAFTGAPVQLGLEIAGVSLADQAAIIQAASLVPDDVLVAAIVPSPFQGLNITTFPPANETELNIVDAGIAYVVPFFLRLPPSLISSLRPYYDSGENLPFWPLLGSDRNMDAIIAIDASGDEDNYPDGRSPRGSCTSIPNFDSLPVRCLKC